MDLSRYESFNTDRYRYSLYTMDILFIFIRDLTVGLRSKWNFHFILEDVEYNINWPASSFKRKKIKSFPERKFSV